MNKIQSWASLAFNNDYILHTHTHTRTHTRARTHTHTSILLVRLNGSGTACYIYRLSREQESIFLVTPSSSLSFSPYHSYRSCLFTAVSLSPLSLSLSFSLFHTGQQSSSLCNLWLLSTPIGPSSSLSLFLSLSLALPISIFYSDFPLSSHLFSHTSYKKLLYINMYFLILFST